MTYSVYFNLPNIFGIKISYQCFSSVSAHSCAYTLVDLSSLYGLLFDFKPREFSFFLTVNFIGTYARAKLTLSEVGNKSWRLKFSQEPITRSLHMYSTLKSTLSREELLF